MIQVNLRPVSDFLGKANRIFKEQKRIISRLLPNAKTEHVGSTAVPGSITKGDVDINVRVERKDFEDACRKLETIYVVDPNNKKTNVIASFKEGKKSELPIGIQLTVIGSRDDDFVKVRDILINNQKLLSELNNLKQRYENKDMEEYRKAKADFFKKLKVN